jgi:hypothetical protein
LQGFKPFVGLVVGATKQSKSKGKTMGKFDLGDPMPMGKGVTKRWRKKINGKQEYFSGKTKAEAVEKLKAFWRELEAAQPEPVEPPGDKWIELMRQSRPGNSVSHLPTDLAALDKLAVNYEIAHQAGREAVERANTDTTLKALAEKFMSEQKEEISVETFASLKKGTEIFVEFASSIRGGGVGADFQGQRVLTLCSGKDLEHVIIVPAAGAAFHGDTVFLGMLL